MDAQGEGHQQVTELTEGEKRIARVSARAARTVADNRPRCSLTSHINEILKRRTDSSMACTDVNLVLLGVTNVRLMRWQHGP